jgi:hypothetical protein
MRRLMRALRTSGGIGFPPYRHRWQVENLSKLGGMCALHVELGAQLPELLGKLVAQLLDLVAMLLGRKVKVEALGDGFENKFA